MGICVFAVLVRTAQWFASRVHTWSDLPYVQTHSTRQNSRDHGPNGIRSPRAKVEVVVEEVIDNLGSGVMQMAGQRHGSSV